MKTIEATSCKMTLALRWVRAVCLTVLILFILAILSGCQTTDLNDQSPAAIKAREAQAIRREKWAQRTGDFALGLASSYAHAMVLHHTRGFAK